MPWKKDVVMSCCPLSLPNGLFPLVPCALQARPKVAVLLLTTALLGIPLTSTGLQLGLLIRPLECTDELVLKGPACAKAPFLYARSSQATKGPFPFVQCMSNKVLLVTDLCKGVWPVYYFLSVFHFARAPPGLTCTCLTMISISCPGTMHGCPSAVSNRDYSAGSHLGISLQSLMLKNVNDSAPWLSPMPNPQQSSESTSPVTLKTVCSDLCQKCTTWLMKTSWWSSDTSEHFLLIRHLDTFCSCPGYCSCDSPPVRSSPPSSTGSLDWELPTPPCYDGN